MKILPNITNISCSRFKTLNESYTLVNFNDNNEIALSYKETDKSNFDILSDLLECKAYATALLYLNENYILSDKYGSLLENKNIDDFYKDCEDLLHKNIKIVEEVGIPLTNINGYKVFEGAGYILRGNGKKKIRESFNERGEIELADITLDYLNNRKYDAEIIGMSRCPKCGYIFNREDNTFEKEEKGVEPYSTINEPYNEKTITYTDKYIKCPNCGDTDNEEDFPWAWVDDLYDAPNANDLVPGIKEDLKEEAEGTQTTDIAPKLDQNLGINKPKKKYKDVLLSDINENEDLLNKGFMKNLDGLYQRGNYILVKEGEKYLAVRKDKLTEDYEGQMSIDEKGLPELPYPYSIRLREDKRYEIVSSHPYDWTDYSWAVSFNDDINSNWRVMDPDEQSRQEVVNGWSEALDLMQKIDATKKPNIDKS